MTEEIRAHAFKPAAILLTASILAGVSCVTTVPLDEVVRQATEHGYKLKNVEQESSVEAGGSAAGSPTSGSGSGKVKVVTKTKFDLVSLEDPQFDFAFGIEQGGSTADSGMSLSLNDDFVKIVDDPAAGTALSAQNGGRWRVFKPASPVTVGAQPSHVDSMIFEYYTSETFALPAKGVALPEKITTRLAMQLGGGQWIVFPADDPIKADDVLISLAAPQGTTSPSLWKMKKGTALAVPAIFMKNTTAGSISARLRARFTQGQNVVSTKTIGNFPLTKYDLKSAKNVPLPSQGLDTGVYALQIAAVTPAGTAGSSQVYLQVTP